MKDHQKEASFPFIEKNSHFEVKEKHKYWFQSQMQMGITALNLTDFVVFTSSRYPILVLKVTLSFRWNDEIKPSLLAFHEKYIKKQEQYVTLGCGKISNIHGILKGLYS